MSLIENDHFLAAGNAQMDTLHAMANIFLSSVERFTTLNINLVHSSLDDVASSKGTLSGVSDFSEAIKLHGEQTRLLIGKAFSYNRGMYEIGAQSREELSYIVEDMIAEFNKGVARTLENVNSNPASSEASIATMKAAVAALNCAYENMSAAGKQAADTIDAKINAVAETFVESGITDQTISEQQSSGRSSPASKSRTRKVQGEAA